jgi:catechol 2,3-dioxygenase-like lactoylglutathione lyase family enzyme
MIDTLFDKYDRGQLSRRDLLGALALLGAVPQAQAASTMRVRTLNHVTLAVSDVERSRKFYQRLFDLPVVSKQGENYNLGVGPSSFLGVYKIGQVSPRIHHVCLGLESFNAEGVVQTLGEHEVKGRIRDRDGVKEVYFEDADGIAFQLQGSDYRG